MTRRHVAANFVAIVTVGLASSSASAQSPEKPFSHAIKQGEFAEECVKLAAGASIDYAFEASERVDFNIHYYLGNNLVYPVRGNQVRRIADRFTAPSDDEYCLTWTNLTAQMVTVKGQLRS
jgi:hypothetical protein